MSRARQKGAAIVIIILMVNDMQKGWLVEVNGMREREYRMSNDDNWQRVRPDAHDYWTTGFYLTFHDRCGVVV